MGKRHKGGKKEFTDTEGLLGLIQSLKDKDGVDGIYITDMDKAVDQFGYGQIEFVVARLIDEINSANTPMVRSIVRFLFWCTKNIVRLLSWTEVISLLNVFGYPLLYMAS